MKLFNDVITVIFIMTVDAMWAIMMFLQKYQEGKIGLNSSKHGYIGADGNIDLLIYIETELPESICVNHLIIAIIQITTQQINWRLCCSMIQQLLHARNKVYSILYKWAPQNIGLSSIGTSVEEIELYWNPTWGCSSISIPMDSMVIPI